MGKQAARIGDKHICPMVGPGGVPHTGGTIIDLGCLTVLIEGQPAATVGDHCLCNGDLDTITAGSSGVFFEGKPAARSGDPCLHGGSIISGCATVLIGERMGGDKDTFIEPSAEEKIVIINQAIQDSIALLERKLKLMEQNDPDTLIAFEKWFGKHEDEGRWIILERMRIALKASKELTINNFSVIKSEKSKRKDYANIYPDDIFRLISLGDRFWSINKLSKKSHAGIIVHELSHFTDVGKTEDIIYGSDRCLEFATKYPSLALNNAESFEWFMIT